MRGHAVLGLAVGVVALSCTSFGSELGPEDAGTDTGIDAVAPVKGACASPAADTRLCFDFESGAQSPPFGFDVLDNPGRGEATLVTAEGRPGRAVRFRLPRGTGSRTIYLVKDVGVLSTAATTYVLEFDMSLVDMTLDYAVIATLAATDAASAKSYGVASHNGGLFSLTTPPVRPVSLSTRQWHKVRVVVAFSPPDSVTTSAFLDGNPAGERKELLGSGKKLDLRMGIYFTAANEGSAEVLLDDIVLRGPK
ncbi:MAG: hypothetical protein JST00_27755 [Deltaproteobacteria bacterium]|nr:hypothetical protein [Deltaproteobacteria bacterium]